MNKRLFLSALLAAAVALQHAAAISVKQPAVENLTHATLGLDTKQPRFSWQTDDETKKLKNVRQTSYRIVVASTIDKINKGDYDLWDTGEVQSDRQLWITYGGKALKSGQHAYWKVHVTTNHGSNWSTTGHFSIGLLSESDWSGYWIGLESLQPGEERGLHTRLAARYLRKEFQLKKKTISRATAYVAGIGLYECYINGKNTDNGHATAMLKPAPSDYRKTIYYNTYDVTPLMDSTICVGIALGNGRLYPMRQTKPYKIPVFGLPKCRINIIVEYTDGSTQRLQTDDKGWKVTAQGPIRANNEYDGEDYDARMEMPGWNQVGYNDASWLKAERTDIPTGQLRGQMLPFHYNNGDGVTFSPKNITCIDKANDRYIVDFGQNMSGNVVLENIKTAHAGDTIRIRYAEKLQNDGTLYTANLRDARSEDIYIGDGKEHESWTATFVYHGFRYVEVKGMRNIKGLHAKLIADPMRNTGSFECSDTILNKVMKNAAWGIMTNYKGMPVDCPQRNERQPWLGDRTVGSLGESFIFDNERLYTKWMRDICEAQRSDGCIPDVAPTFWNYFSDNVTWPAALPFTCDMLWRQFGNKQPIADSYPAIKKWVLHMIERYGRNGIIEKDRYGDWCPPPEKPELIHSQDPARKTDGTLLSTAYLIRTMQLMEQWGCEPDYWRPIREQMTEAFNHRFLTVKRGTSPRPGHVLYPDSVFYGNNTATANLLPLAFGIVPEDCKADVIKNVVENIVIKNKGHVSCGVIGISWLMRTLSNNGFADVAFLLATQRTYPSWGYMAENGATTIWELWNGDKANPAMNSGNHVMLLGDLVTWAYQYLGGIRQNDSYDTTAYKNMVLQPAFGIQNCDWAKTSFQSPYGQIVSNWKKTLQHVEWDVEIPCNTTATIYLPDGTTQTVGSGAYHYSTDIPTADAAIVKDEFLYDHTYFPEAHASTIVETKKGDLVAAYFGGTHERDPDVCIYVNVKKKGKDAWTAPILAADGVFELGSEQAKLAGLSGIDEKTTSAEAGPVKTISDKRKALSYNYVTKKSNVALPATMKRKACWNPVLFEMPNGELWLFFKIGSTVGDWTGWVTKSRDGGLTWSDKEPLPEGFIGPVKNKPELIDNRLICGSSTESKGWRFHVEILDLSDGAWKTKKAVKELNWKYVGPVTSTEAVKTDDNKQHPIDCIQPSILKLKDGRLQVLMRTHNARLATSFSSDNGETWTPVTLSEVENNQSGTDAVTLQDGRHMLIYNNFETLPLTKKGPRTPISLAISEDGQTWHHVLTLENSPIDQYSYPAIIQGKNGHLYCVYTWRRQRVAFKEINPKLLKMPNSKYPK